MDDAPGTARRVVAGGHYRGRAQLRQANSGRIVAIPILIFILAISADRQRRCQHDTGHNADSDHTPPVE
jgi:hypothetical protein